MVKKLLKASAFLATICLVFVFSLSKANANYQCPSSTSKADSCACIAVGTDTTCTNSYCNKGLACEKFVDSACQTNGIRPYTIDKENPCNTAIWPNEYNAPTVTCNDNTQVTFTKSCDTEANIAFYATGFCATHKTCPTPPPPAPSPGPINSGSINLSPASGTNQVTNVSTQQIAAGDNHACAVISPGKVKCWGRNDLGQLGNSSAGTNLPVEVPGITTATQVAAGRSFTCALLSDKTVKCWGRNDVGQLGNGTNTSISTPTTVRINRYSASPLSNVIQISAGGDTACAVHAGGTASCWGRGTSGQLGNDTTENSNIPVSVINSFGSTTFSIQQITVGYSHVCARRDNNDVICWGSNGKKEARPNNDKFLSKLTPSCYSWQYGCNFYNNGSALILGASSMSRTTCAVNGSHNAVCWGSNEYLQRNSGAEVGSNTAGNVQGIGLIWDIAASLDMVCAVMDDYTIKCRGNDQLTPFTPISGITIKSIVAGEKFFCGISNNTSGTVYCWGNNTYGQLGNGAAPAPTATPTPTGEGCDPDPTGASAGRITGADLIVARNEILGIAATNKASCMTTPAHTTTNGADILRIRNTILGITQ